MDRNKYGQEKSSGSSILRNPDPEVCVTCCADEARPDINRVNHKAKFAET